MSQINVDASDKELFDELKPSDATQAEFFAEVMETYEYADEPVRIDTEAIVDEITHKTAPQIELAARKGIKEAIEEIGIQ